MRVHEFEDAMFDDEIEYYAHYVGWWAVFEQQMLVFLHEVNQGCYDFFVCVQQHDISCGQQGIGWKRWEFFDNVEKTLCLFDV